MQHNYQLYLYLAFFCFFKYVSLCKIWLLESLVEYSLISLALYTDDSPHTITNSLFFHILLIILSILFKFCFCNLHAWVPNSQLVKEAVILFFLLFPGCLCSFSIQSSVSCNDTICRCNFFVEQREVFRFKGGVRAVIMPFGLVSAWNKRRRSKSQDQTDPCRFFSCCFFFFFFFF